MSKKLIQILSLSLLGVVGLFLLYGYANSIKPYYLHENEDEDVCAVYPYSHGIMQVGDTIRFRIDTGSQVSLLRQADVDLLKRNGVPMDSVWFPSLAKNIHGKPYLSTKRYIASLPVKDRKLVTDPETGEQYYERTGKVINRIMNMAFLSADPNDSVSTLGINVLENFVVEYQASRKAIVLRKRVPIDYQFVSDIKAPISLMQLLGLGGKYYLEVSAENNRNPYRIDTGIQDLDLKLPPEDARAQDSDETERRLVRTSRGTVQAKYTNKLWVKLGNRQGTHSAFYSDGEEDSYAINPINFYSQDFVLDFPGRKLYLHPTAKNQ